ncbi:TPA: hypothetical protein N3K56_005199 [Klebsiella aerogenes]|nr:hypothetical protein [Klebsiella aerogenes]
MKQSKTFKKFAKGCGFIAIGIIAATYQLLYVQINSEAIARLYNINKKEVEQFNDWFLSWNNPFIHFSLFFGILSLVFYLLHRKTSKTKLKNNI